MSRHDKDAYLERVRFRYHTSSKGIKKLILDEFCANFSYNRKYAIDLLHHSSEDKPKRRRGPKVVYDKEKLFEPLRNLWLATDQMCGKRLKHAIPLWLPFYEDIYGKLDEQTKSLLLKISPATIDRLLKPCHQLEKIHGLSGTRPGYLLKNQIPIKTDHWDVNQPGYMEADTVAHCGNSMRGDFVWSLTTVDIHSAWTEIRATWNKGAYGIVEQIKDIEASLPFVLKGFDCDNGSEFLNYTLLEYLQDRKQEVQFTRSRPYKKNDNAHVEQKNWTGVRHVFGYYRLDKQLFVEMMNDIYKNEWRLLLNFFYPSMQLKEKVKINSKYHKKYHSPLTPYQRLMSSPHISEKKKAALKKQKEELNPFELRKSLQAKLKAIFDLAPALISNPKRKI